jgi:hypothetical protein
VIAGKPERELSHFSTAAQSELFYTDSENDPTQIEKCRALSSPPLPSARAGIRAYKTQRGLAGVFSISGSHLVRLVPQFESGQNCSDGFTDWAQPSNEGLERFL